MSTKRLLALLLALTMCFSLAAPAYATETDTVYIVTLQTLDGKEEKIEVVADQGDVLGKFGVLNKPEDPTRENSGGKRYVFVQWNQNGNNAFPDNKTSLEITGDTTLTAMWEEYLAEGYELLLPDAEEPIVTNYTTPLDQLIGNNTKMDIRPAQRVMLTSVADSDVAQIGDKGYATLESAIAAANAVTTATAENPVVVKLLKDVSVTAPIMISNSITLDGGKDVGNDNYTITTSANRGIRIDTASVNVTVKNLNINGGTKMERAIQVDSGKDDVTLTIDNVTATATTYTVNICGDVDNLNMTVKDSDLTGWGVINLWGNSGTVSISGSTLLGINDKTYNADGWNNFGVVVMEGDTTGQTDEHSSAYEVNIRNSTIEAKSTTGNTQYVLLHNKPSVSNTVVLDNCDIVIGENNCKFFRDGAKDSVTKVRPKAGTELPELSVYYIYSPVDSDGYYTINGVVAWRCNVVDDSLEIVEKYSSLQEALNDAADGQLVYMTRDVIQDDGILIDKQPNATVGFWLGGHTLTVNNGGNVNNRAIKIESGTLEVFGGKIVAVGSGTTSQNGKGCYGAFRVEANGKLIASDLELENSRPWGLNVKVLGGEAELENVTITSRYGGGIEVTEADLGTHSKTGKATLTDCTFTQSGYFDHCSTALSVSGGSELIVNSGTYTGEYALYVFSSGGVINVKDGTFEAISKNAIIAAIDTNTYPTYTGGLKIEGGKFTGTFSITSPAYAEISGGHFTADPTPYLAKGFDRAESQEQGYNWTVKLHEHSFDSYAPNEKEPTWTWRRVNNAWAAYATFFCDKEDGGKLDVIATISTETVQGNKETVATVKLGDKTFTDSKTEVETYKVYLDGVEQNSYNWGKLCTLIADGTKKWYIGDSTGADKQLMADARKTYVFAVTGDTYIWTEDSSETQEIAAITSTMKAENNNTAIFNVKWSLPDEADVKSVTVYRAYNRLGRVLGADVGKEREMLGMAASAVDLRVRNGDFTYTITDLGSDKYPGEHFYQNAQLWIIYTVPGIDGDQELFSPIGTGKSQIQVW